MDYEKLMRITMFYEFIDVMVHYTVYVMNGGNQYLVMNDLSPSEIKGFDNLQKVFNYLRKYTPDNLEDVKVRVMKNFRTNNWLNLLSNNAFKNTAFDTAINNYVQDRLEDDE